MAETRDSVPDSAPDLDLYPENASDLRRMVYAESEISAYNHITSASLNSDPFKFNARRSESNDTHSSFPTSNYSESDSTAVKKPQHETQNRNTIVMKEQLPSAHARMISNLSTASVQTIDSPRKMKSTAFAKLVPTENDQLYNSALAAKIRIRESVEMDPFASLRSNELNGSSLYRHPSARLSEIENKSVITLRMRSINGKPQVRLKLYLPLTANVQNSTPPQIIMLFVNKGVDMLSVRMFLEDNYPYKVLKGRIKQICIADEDGEMDEDFPPINDARDITSLGVQDFWIERIFEDGNTHTPPSIIYSEQEKRVKNSQYGSVRDDDDYSANRKGGCCCWCTWRKEKVQFVEAKQEEKEYCLSVSDYQKILDDSYNKSKESNAYQPPNIKPKNDESESDGTKSNVQFANV